MCEHAKVNVAKVPAFKLSCATELDGGNEMRQNAKRQGDFYSEQCPERGGKWVGQFGSVLPRHRDARAIQNEHGPRHDPARPLTDAQFHLAHDFVWDVFAYAF